jgi:transposase
LAEQAFAHPADHIVLQEALNAERGAAEQVKRLEAASVEIVPTWSMAPVVGAFQAMRVVGFVAAVIFVAELGDLGRFDHLTKDEKHTGGLRNRDHLLAFGDRAGGGAGVMIGLSLDQ